MSNTQEYIDRVVKYRGLPSVKKGAPCEVCGKKGVVWGGNSAANFNVKFANNQVSNCHPYWRMKIFNNDGSLLYESPEN